MTGSQKVAWTDLGTGLGLRELGRSRMLLGLQLGCWLAGVEGRSPRQDSGRKEVHFGQGELAMFLRQPGDMRPLVTGLVLRGSVLAGGRDLSIVRG